MKKRLFILWLFLLTVLLISCRESPLVFVEEDSTWEIVEVDGSFYISFPHNERPADNGVDISVVEGLHFDSVEEAQQAFLHGKLTAGEITHIKQTFALTKHGFFGCFVKLESLSLWDNDALKR